MHCQKDKGFTLIELSIVLVIIGLLVGGILLGHDLVKAAQIRSVLKDIETYKTATNTFKLKYNCLAGDCPNATTFWVARNANNTTCKTITPTLANPTPTCNGNNNGRVDNNTEEQYLFWQHLANAGIIRGQYTGIHDGAFMQHHVLGQNSPNTAIPLVGFGFSYLDYPTGDGATYGMNYGNLLWLGKQHDTERPQASFLGPSAAMAMEAKIDDGKPATGFIIMRSDELYFGDINSCTTSTSPTDYSGTYNTGSSAISCAFMIKTGL